MNGELKSQIKLVAQIVTANTNIEQFKAKMEKLFLTSDPINGSMKFTEDSNGGNLANDQ